VPALCLTRQGLLRSEPLELIHDRSNFTHYAWNGLSVTVVGSVYPPPGYTPWPQHLWAPWCWGLLLRPSQWQRPFTPDAINRLVKIIGQRAGLALPVHFHMLRHSCGYKLANDGIDTRAIQDWLGHASITHTTRYTALSPTRFKDFWRD
jgi:Phage integrase family